jgi:hypothetical protein
MRQWFISLLVTALLSISTVAQSGQKARVFITDSQSWETSGSAGGSGGSFAAHSSGGARPQTAEIIKTFGQRCPDVIVNNRADRADYVVLLDHEGGKGLAMRDNKVVVFNSDGDSIVSHSTRSLGNAVKDACDAISQDWPAHAGHVATSSQPSPTAVSTDKPAEGSSVSKVTFTSTPVNADIEVDGNFVGNTPSTVQMTVGQHSIVIKKTGYKNWERNMKVSGGEINLAAELEKAQ